MLDEEVIDDKFISGFKFTLYAVHSDQQLPRIEIFVTNTPKFLNEHSVWSKLISIPHPINPKPVTFI